MTMKIPTSVPLKERPGPLRRHVLLGAGAAVAWGRGIRLGLAYSPTLSLPSPPPLQGTIHHIAPIGNSQTSAIQAVIDAASLGDTIYFDSGTHIINGTLTPKSGHLYIGPTAQFADQGRAVLQFSNTGSFQADNVGLHNVAFYGLSLLRTTPWIFNGSTRITWTNCFFDNQDYAGAPDFIDMSKDTNNTIQWCTFQSGAGLNNDGFGNKSTNLTITRNRFLNCREAIGTLDNNSRNMSITFNYISGTARMAIECTGDGRRGMLIADNYIENFASNAGEIGISLVGSGGGEIARNYIAGGPGQGYGIETDATGGDWIYCHDNYIDQVNQTAPSPWASAIIGPYTNGPDRYIDNNIIGPSQTIDCAAPSCGKVTVSGTAHVNRGKPSQPASGAGP